ncbi:Zinc finger C2H2 [Penicillium verhagenii]|uniref:Zinc finger C2H2 n=1 Tax=Penicillium verhagenii TaxID=1562060 RepID=UPI002544F0E3|nr:Zinc finger C2H2 [Penicillium verhagenii]KAJ5917496.1 Zinc finger C2H2 [Penicillium verhagenii]
MSQNQVGLVAPTNKDARYHAHAPFLTNGRRNAKNGYLGLPSVRSRSSPFSISVVKTVRFDSAAATVLASTAGSLKIARMDDQASFPFNMQGTRPRLSVRRARDPPRTPRVRFTAITQIVKLNLLLSIVLVTGSDYSATPKICYHMRRPPDAKVTLT